MIDVGVVDSLPLPMETGHRSRHKRGHRAQVERSELTSFPRAFVWAVFAAKVPHDTFRQDWIALVQTPTRWLYAKLGVRLGHPNEGGRPKS